MKSSWPRQNVFRNTHERNWYLVIWFHFGNCVSLRFPPLFLIGKVIRNLKDKKKFRYPIGLSKKIKAPTPIKHFTVSNAATSEVSKK